ncbi:MAG TPA: TrkA family potassium uptake protein [Jatrophihabitans sp.]|nr:TrkA family potassium uptake protein [Jatrophihabitans sp.]
MRVAVAGAGNVGQSIARSLLADGHKVLLIERRREHYRPALVDAADWLLADACELAALQEAGIETADVVIAATGDDKANVVFSMLCKTQFAVPRVVARINDPANQWLFTGDWGVDVAVSTPGSLSAALEGAASIGEVVRLITLQHGQAEIVEMTVSATSRLVGRSLADLSLPTGCAPLTITRDRSLVTPTPTTRLQAGDAVVLLVAPDELERVRAEVLS